MATTSDLTSMPAERLLVLLGGICAIAFGGLSLVLYLIDQPLPTIGAGFSGMGGMIFVFAVDFVFGLALLLAAARMTQTGAEGGILALAFSVVLLAFGGTSGIIAGVVGLVGALTGIVRNLKFNA